MVTIDRRIDALRNTAGCSTAALKEAALEQAALERWLSTAAKHWPEFAQKLEPLRRSSLAITKHLGAHAR